MTTYGKGCNGGRRKVVRYLAHIRRIYDGGGCDSQRYDDIMAVLLRIYVVMSAATKDDPIWADVQPVVTMLWQLSWAIDCETTRETE